MKIIVITAKNEVREVAVGAGEALYDALRAAVGGWIELVKPLRLGEPLRMVVDEDGLSKGKPVNLAGCALYGTDIHCSPIVGDIAIAKVKHGDLAGLTDAQAARLTARLEAFIDAQKKSRENAARVKHQLNSTQKRGGSQA